MQIIDTHCDLLYQMRNYPDESFFQSNVLNVNFQELILFEKYVQCMALYVPPSIPFVNRYLVALEMVTIFQEKVIRPSNGRLVQIYNSEMIKELKDDQTGVILTVEGCDVIGDQRENFETLYALGARIFGLTWNHANLIADGILEKRGAGLSNLGHEFVSWVNEKDAWLDVSHLSEKGFWDVIENGNKVMASHSNVKNLCSHPRNLTDEQIKALIRKNGYIGVTFVPQFLSDDVASISDVVKHIDYICSLGGENHIGFGSDFDGFDNPISNLYKPSHFNHLIEELQKYYSSVQIQKFLSGNFIDICKF